MNSTKFTTQAAIGASFGPPVQPVLPNTPAVVCEGWLLKKRRKKMQGFARRYFILYHSGLLAYSFEPGQPIRDQVSLHHAAISSEVGRKDIHVDSNTATFHIKCLSRQDFELWMAAIRKFISNGVEARRSASIRIAARQSNAHLSRTGDIVDEMAATIQELEKAFSILSHHSQMSTSAKDHSINSRRSDRDKYKEKFALFKKSSPTLESTEADTVLVNHAAMYMQIQNTIDQLKIQHATLTKMVQTHPFGDPPTSQMRMSPVPDVVEEEEETTNPKPASPVMSTSAKNWAYRASIATSLSDSINEWYDAVEGGVDGPEEFVMDLSVPPGDHLEHHPSQATTSTDTQSFMEQQDDSSIDTDIDEEEPLQSAGIGSVQMSYRTHLPVVCPADEGSLFGILKNNVGKDLSTITFPVTFNEPLTLLQRAAEEVEYWDLLDQAALSEDPVTRLCYVAAFAVSGYAHTRHRSGKKGFNPMLGETFEDIRTKFIAEKVRHNPVEIAYHAEGKGWELTALSSGRTKFWGKSLEIIPTGPSRLRIGSDEYIWNKPSTFIRNLMVGTKYFEHCGNMNIEHIRTGMRCALDFKQNGYWGPTNVISGTVHASDGEILSKLEGKWDDQMAQTLDNDHLHVLWRCSAFPKNTLQYYGFTSFGMALNEITDEIFTKLPCTDSRLRPDVRALENGELDIAEQEKVRLEELQRDRRRRGEDAQPRWFKQVGEEWEYVGGYWEARARAWKAERIPALW